MMVSLTMSNVQQQPSQSEFLYGELIHVQSLYGTITPTHVVDYAEAKDSPLHRYFEWNDKKAADQHRLQQARQLIASVTVERQKEKPELRAFVNVTKGGERQYLPILEVLDDKKLTMQVLTELEYTIKSFQRKLSTLCTYERKAHEFIGDLSDQLTQFRDKLEE